LISIYTGYASLLSCRFLQSTMPITACPIAREGGRCQDVQCHLRHDIVECKPCGSFVLHERLARHRRGEEHMQNCSFPEWKAKAKSPASAIPPLPYPRVPIPPPRKPTRSQATNVTTGGTSNRSGQEPRVIVSKENGLTLKSTTGQDGTSSMTATAPIVIKKVRQNDSLALVDVDLTGAESNSFSTTIVGKLPMPIKWKKSPQIHVSFLSDAPGERNAVLLLHFLERGSGQGFIIKRKVRGVATSPMEKPRPQPSKPPPGSKASNRRVKRGQTRARQPNKVQHL